MTVDEYKLLTVDRLKITKQYSDKYIILNSKDIKLKENQLDFNNRYFLILKDYIINLNLSQNSNYIKILDAFYFGYINDYIMKQLKDL